MKLIILFSAVGISISSAVAGANYYFQSGKTDFSKTSSYLVEPTTSSTCRPARRLK